jgi:hypothetical protein
MMALHSRPNNKTKIKKEDDDDDDDDDDET